MNKKKRDKKENVTKLQTRSQKKSIHENGSAGLSAKSMDSPGADHLVFDAEVVQNAGIGGHQGLSVGDVDPDRHPRRRVLLLQLHYRVLAMDSRR